jgi:hypothetical protein
MIEAGVSQIIPVLVPFRSPLVNTQSQLRSRSPVELFCSLQTLRAQRRAKLRVLYHLCEGINEGLRVERIEQQTRFADNFRETGSISCNYRHAALHCFNHRQAKALEIRWINETDSAAI